MGIAATIRRKMADFIVHNLGLTDSALYSHFGLGESYGGRVITSEGALSLSTAYRCIRLISESVAVLPCKLYRTMPSGEVVVDQENPLYQLLHDSPNRHQTSFEFWEAMAQSLAMWGNAYAVKEMVGNRVVALTPVRPDMISIYKVPKTREIRYRATIDGVQEDFPLDRVFHVKGWGGGFSLVGASPIQLGRHGLGLASAVEEAASKIFQNGLRPSGFIRVDQVLKKEQRDQIKTNMAEYMGSANSGKLMVLEGGMQYQQLALPPEDAQMLETRAFNVEEICRWFGVPPYLAFSTEKSTTWGTGLEQQQLGFLIFSLMPYLERIEQAANKWLLGPSERLTRHVEFSVEGILRADSKARAEFSQKMVLSGIYTPDEVRRTEGRPAMGGNAAKLWMPVNMALTEADRTAPATQTPALEEVQ
jgi:HK97 family phage portal protein